MTTDRGANNQRILLIGATGQVGRELLAILAGRGALVATARNPAAVIGGCECRPLDLMGPESARRIVREVRPTVIINAAAYTAVDRAETEPEQARTVNEVIPGVLAEEAARIGAAVVHYSTDYVFDGSGTHAWRVEDPTGPLNVYGRTKLAGEEAIRRSGAAHAILRISWVYAAHGNNFVKTMLRLAAERSELRVVADQIGAPTSARCVAETTAQVLERAGSAPADFLRQRGGTFHAPCGGETSWHGFAEEIFRLARTAGLPLRVEKVAPIASAEYPTPAARPLNSRLDGTRLAERLGLRLPEWRAALAEDFPAIVAGMNK